jgi:hypothetical protein
MESAQESISVMIEQEEKYSRCRNYKLGLHPTPSFCTCETSQRGLHFLQECAMVVTDLAHQPIKTVPSSPRSALGKFTSGVSSVQDFMYLSTRSSSTLSSNDLCCVCSKPCQQEPPFPPCPSEDSLQFWHEQMFEWSCTVADSYDISDRSGVVALSFSLLDRYLAQDLSSDDGAESTTHEEFRLLGMTTLYLAVRQMEGYKLTIDDLVMESRGFYSAQDIIVMENEILAALQSCLNPPTAIAYCRLMLLALPEDGRQIWAEVEHCCIGLTEIAAANVAFVAYKASAVALASIVLAARLRGISEDEIEHFVGNLEEIIKTDIHDSEFQRVYCQLERVLR